MSDVLELTIIGMTVVVIAAGVAACVQVVEMVFGEA
jgi:hypothetical protein